MIYGVYHYRRRGNETRAGENPSCGYAVGYGEYILDIQAVAVSVCDGAGQTIAALSITYPGFRGEDIDTEQMAKYLLQTSSAVSKAPAFEEKSPLPARLTHN